MLLMKPARFFYQRGQKLSAVVNPGNELRLTLTPDSDDKKLSLNSSEDDNFGFALFEAYSQEVVVDGTSEC